MATRQDRFEDVFQYQVMPAIAGITDFKEFARSKYGLCLEDTIITTITEDHERSVRDQKMEMLLKWKQKNRRATPRDILDILEKYLEKEENLTRNIEQSASSLEAAPIKPASEIERLARVSLQHTTPPRGLDDKITREVQRAADSPLIAADSVVMQPQPLYKANAIIFFNRSDKHLYSYKFSTEELKKMQNFAGEQFTTVRLRKHIYKINGQDIQKLEYVTPTAEWVGREKLNENHGEAPSATVLGNSIYVCGNPTKPESSGVEKYDSSEDAWKCKQNEKISRCRTSIVGVKDRIYCIGVENGVENSCQAVEHFLGVEWKYINPIMNRAFVGCATVLGDLIYVLCNDMKVHCYNTNTRADPWSKPNIADPWPFQGDVKILTANENLYLVGNTSSSSKFGIYSFDPTTGQMTPIKEIENKDFIVAASLAAYFE